MRHDAGRLRRALRGDLDTIVAKALKKNAAERYASVTALADDLRRYLRHEPISARPDTLRYRAAKFVRRHARGVAAAAAVVLLLGGLTAFYTARLATERDRAQREAAKAAKVSEVLTGLLTGADPVCESARPRTNRRSAALLDAGAEQVQKELVGQPELQAEMLTRHGQDVPPPRRLRQGTAAARTGAGERHGRRSAPEHVERGPDASTISAPCWPTRATTQRRPQRLEQALAMRRRLWARSSRCRGHAVRARPRLPGSGLNERAEPLQREALGIRRKVLGDEHRETAVSLSDLASVLRLNGDLRAPRRSSSNASR